MRRPWTSPRRPKGQRSTAHDSSICSARFGVDSRCWLKRVHSFVERLRKQVNQATCTIYVMGLYRTLDAIAPDRDWRWLKRAAQRMAREVDSRSKQHRLVLSGRLLRLGVRLMDSVANSNSNLCRIKYRDGLIIALLAARPIRLRHLAMMRVGQHLKKSGWPGRPAPCRCRSPPG